MTKGNRWYSILLSMVIMACNSGENQQGKIAPLRSTTEGDGNGGRSVQEDRQAQLTYHSLRHEINYLDVVGDSAMDTLILGPFDGKATSLNLLEKGVPRNILMIEPRFLGMPEYVSTSPPIERIYLEANNVQSDEKSLRLIIRNTDMVPEYCFFDIYFEGDDIRIGLCGVYDLGEIDSVKLIGRPMLCTAVFNRTIERSANGKRVFFPGSILGMYWPNGYVCDPCALDGEKKRIVE